jgi:RND family efflux transporter MFP subunit
MKVRFPVTKSTTIILGAVVVVVALIGGGIFVVGGLSSSTEATEQDVPEPESGIHVQVVKPQPGGMDRKTTQPGTVEAFKRVDIESGVSGFLKTLNVDRDSRVKEGDILAIIDVPDLQKTLERNEAGIDQAKAKVEQMVAEKTVAEAQLEAAKAKVKQAIAAAKAAKAWVIYRAAQLDRMQYLFSKDAVEQRVLDEAKDNYEAAVESQNSAEENIAASKANQVAAGARIGRTEADIEAARAEVKVTQAEFAKTGELLKYATIRAPFDGIITRRTVNPGAFIRAATTGTAAPPILTIDSVDVYRVVVDVPDKDAPLVKAGEDAVIEFDALPDVLFRAPVARTGGAEDPQTRMMRVEIDVKDNPDAKDDKDKLKHGMYGRVTITLKKDVDVLALPSSCLVDKSDKTNRGQVYVVEKGRAKAKVVTIQATNEVSVGITGLSPNDLVIANPQAGIIDGTPVIVPSPTRLPPKTQKKR